ncbi:MAG: DUF819 family protein [Bacteroidales bacterium]|nr:DUF819 family protein [Bacteroidales bacterium]
MYLPINLLIIAICLFTPLLILWLTYRFPFLNKVGTIIIAYVIGCVLGLTGLIPDTPEIHKVQTDIATYTIPFAIPLLLFSADIKSWTKLAPSFIKSTLLGIAGCCIAIVIGFLVCAGDDKETFASIGGMLTGLYTGGNANLASIKVALGVDDTVYIITSAYSTLLSAVYLIFVILFGKRTLRLLLPDFKYSKNCSDGSVTVKNHEQELFYGLFRKSNLPTLGKSLLLTIIIIALGAGIALLCPKRMFQTVFILGISTLAIIASTNKRVRNMERTFEAGTYLILVFSIAVASQVNTHTLGNIDPRIFLFISIATLGSLLMHVLLSALLRIDTDTTLASSISLICSPPFVPVVAGAVKNKAIIGPGIAVGLFGYAVGTYVGFFLARLLLLL